MLYEWQFHWKGSHLGSSPSPYSSEKHITSGAGTSLPGSRLEVESPLCTAGIKSPKGMLPLLYLTLWWKVHENVPHNALTPTKNNGMEYVMVHRPVRHGTENCNAAVSQKSRLTQISARSEGVFYSQHCFRKGPNKEKSVHSLVPSERYTSNGWGGWSYTPRVLP